MQQCMYMYNHDKLEIIKFECLKPLFSEMDMIDYSESSMSRCKLSINWDRGHVSRYSWITEPRHKSRHKLTNAHYASKSSLIVSVRTASLLSIQEQLVKWLMHAVLRRMHAYQYYAFCSTALFHHCRQWSWLYDNIMKPDDFCNMTTY